MLRIITVLTLCWFVGCATSRGPSTSSSNDPPRPKPAECINCNSSGTNIAMCAGPQSACYGACTGDPSQLALCQQSCMSEYHACMHSAVVASCPGYCNLYP
jgi:hypothetical protein